MSRRREGQILEIEFSILDAALELQRLGADVYGFSLAKTISEMSGSRSLTAHGTLYKALSRLVDRGLLESAWEAAEVAEEAGRPRRRLYTVTGEGARAAASQVAERSVSVRKVALA
ncbi:PadR family transcriptional regulator [Leifsonia sp. WHRI 6310E]|uniref:PadR family transcriptional regulator n=1 Tax=Leifsonia sp. WHRI 6310E TaxID=3162562 RepID=UPI0032EAFA5F